MSAKARQQPSLYQLHVLTIQGAGKRLFALLSEQVPGLSRTLARKAVEAGLVEVNGQPWRQPTQALPEGEVVVRCDFRQGITRRFQAMRHGLCAVPEEPPCQVLYRDEELMVVDKAAGALSAPAHQGQGGHVQEFLYHWLRQQGEKVDFIGLVHRLDQETSGCLCFALRRQAQRLLARQFARHLAERRYSCLVWGGPRQDSDALQSRIGRGRDGRRAVVGQAQPGKSAITHFQVLERFADAAELLVRLETGRTHQIRVHLASIGCPVIGDRVYGRRGKGPDPGRLMLHAAELHLDHPRTQERLHLVAPLPQAYRAMRQRLAEKAPGPPILPQVWRGGPAGPWD
jgi:23S rRNA pseudouridine1911/1915/1917 synthase